MDLCKAMLVLCGTIYNIYYFRKGVDNNNPPPRFDKHLEEFYSICDQIELHLVNVTGIFRNLSSLSTSFFRKPQSNVCNRVHQRSDICLFLWHCNALNRCRLPRTDQYHTRNTCLRFVYKSLTPRTFTTR